MGMFVGAGLRNNDVFVMTARGRVKGKTIIRRPPEDHIIKYSWSELWRVPWNFSHVTWRGSS